MGFRKNNNNNNNNNNNQTQKTPYKCTVENCGAEFATMAELLAHRLAMHKDDWV